MKNTKLNFKDKIQIILFFIGIILYQPTRWLVRNMGSIAIVLVWSVLIPYLLYSLLEVPLIKIGILYIVYFIVLLCWWLARMIVFKDTWVNKRLTRIQRAWCTINELYRTLKD